MHLKYKELETNASLTVKPLPKIADAGENVRGRHRLGMVFAEDARVGEKVGAYERAKAEIGVEGERERNGRRAERGGRRRRLIERVLTVHGRRIGRYGGGVAVRDGDHLVLEAVVEAGSRLELADEIVLAAAAGDARCLAVTRWRVQ